VIVRFPRMLPPIMSLQSRHGAPFAAAIATLVAGAAFVAATAAAADAGLTRSAAPAAVITSVAFSGSPAKPTVTVTGRGLSIPAPTPSTSPSNQPLCPKVIKGNAGLDYGTRLYVTAFSNDKLKYSAGRYRPGLQELDCIGIIVLSHSPTKIRFQFGAAYRQADFGYPHITNGDLVEVVVNGGAYGLVVRYH
jgi:hypothetical protein